MYLLYRPLGRRELRECLQNRAIRFAHASTEKSVLILAGCQPLMFLCPARVQRYGYERSFHSSTTASRTKRRRAIGMSIEVRDGVTSGPLTDLSKHLTNLWARDEIPMSSKNVVQRFRVISFRWVREAQGHVLRERNGAIRLQTWPSGHSKLQLNEEAGPTLMVSKIILSTFVTGRASLARLTPAAGR